MTNNNDQGIDFDRVKIIQNSFENTMKLLEKNIADSISNKGKIEVIKNDLIEANKKFSEAEKCLNRLKMELKNKKNI